MTATSLRRLNATTMQDGGDFACIGRLTTLTALNLEFAQREPSSCSAWAAVERLPKLQRLTTALYYACSVEGELLSCLQLPAVEELKLSIYELSVEGANELVRT
jgi:hypothetical protein